MAAESELRALVSLHDVTPAHQSDLERAEALLESVGVSRVAYLLVPNFHRRHPILGDPAFAAWCRRARPLAVDWVLHGCYHAKDVDAAADTGAAEFLALDPAAQVERLALGVTATTATVGVVPKAFVAPAWRFNRALMPALEALGFRHTEDARHVIDVRRGDAQACPVIAWAARPASTRPRSRRMPPAGSAARRQRRCVRMALHPTDFHHAETTEQIRRVLGAALDTRACVGYADAFTPAC